MADASVAARGERRRPSSAQETAETPSRTGDSRSGATAEPGRSGRRESPQRCEPVRAELRSQRSLRPADEPQWSTSGASQPAAHVAAVRESAAAGDSAGRRACSRTTAEPRPKPSALRSAIQLRATSLRVRWQQARATLPTGRRRNAVETLGAAGSGAGRDEPTAALRRSEAARSEPAAPTAASASA